MSINFLLFIFYQYLIFNIIRFACVFPFFLWRGSSGEFNEQNYYNAFTLFMHALTIYLLYKKDKYKLFLSFLALFTFFVCREVMKLPISL